MIEGTEWTKFREGPVRKAPDPRPFFEETLPLAIVKNADAFMARPCVITLIVRGKGAWTIRFGDETRPIERGRAKDADLFVMFTPTAFTKFMDGSLKVPRALATGHLKTRGDRRLFSRFAQVLDTRPKNMIAARAAF